MRLINTRILSQPMNYVTVWMMLFIAAIAIHFCWDFYKSVATGTVNQRG